MGSLLGVAIEGLSASAAGRWFMLASLAAIVALMVVAIPAEHRRMEDLNKQEVAAFDLWMGECSKPVDECAAAWDNGWSLREMYRDRVRP